jgi:hypothetical protein
MAGGAATETCSKPSTSSIDFIFRQGKKTTFFQIQPKPPFLIVKKVRNYFGIRNISEFYFGIPKLFRSFISDSEIISEFYFGILIISEFYFGIRNISGSDPKKKFEFSKKNSFFTPLVFNGQWCNSMKYPDRLSLTTPASRETDPNKKNKFLNLEPIYLGNDLFSQRGADSGQLKISAV